MITGFLNLPWFFWSVVALIAAGFRFFIIRWGHTLTWILLAINFFLRGISPPWMGPPTWSPWRAGSYTFCLSE